MEKNKWLEWLQCNALEIVILILVLVLLVKVFNVPAAEVSAKETAVQEELVGETSVEGGEQLLPETTEELPAEPNTSE